MLHIVKLKLCIRLVVRTLVSNILWLCTLTAFENSEYFAEWENIRARVVRPDVQCIDGVIHVIDHVLVQRREISVSGSGRFAFDALLLLSITLTAIFLNALQH